MRTQIFDKGLVTVDMLTKRDDKRYRINNLQYRAKTICMTSGRTSSQNRRYKNKES